MQPETFDLWKTIVQIASLILSILLNSALIFLIITKSAKKMGNYRHLMVYFCCCSMMFSSMDIFVRPVIRTHKSAFYMIMDLRNRDLPLKLAAFLVCAMAGCFGVIIYGIAIHFVYRYFALEQHGRIKYFERKYLPFWFLIPLIGGAGWTLVSWFLFPMTPVTSAYIGPDLLASVNINVNQSAYAAAVLFPTGENGVKSFNWQCGMGLISYLIIMAVPFYVVIFVGVKSAGKIKQLPSSCYAKRLQMELYKALVAQTVIPIILLFAPFAVIFLCPIMEIDCTSLATILTFVYAIYPVVDPLPIFFFVQNYRNALRDVFFCRERSNSSKIHAVPEDASGEEYSA